MNIQSIKIALGIIMSCLIISCADTGGDVTAGIGGSGRVSSGSITGFGSVFVNGVEFETDSATFNVDGTSGTENDLAIGMIVSVSGSINDDGVTGIATNIDFNDQLQGPVTLLSAIDADGVSRTFSILGTNVIINSTTTIFDISGKTGIPANTVFDFDTIAKDNNVEINGFFDSSNNLHGTRVELKNITFDANSIVEVKGTISTLSGTSFTLGGLTIDASSATLDDLPNGLVSGIFVEVKGSFNSATNTLTATKVEAEDDDFDDANEFEIEGLITDYVSDSNFKISGITVNASGAMREPTTLILSNDIRVEAEGAIINGVLIAEKIKTREGSIKIHAPVSSVNATENSFNVRPVASQPAITITVTSSTRLNNDVNSIEPFSLSNLVANTDFVEVEGFIDNDGNIIATEVEVKEADDIVVQATIESGDATAGTIKLLGVEFIIDYPNETSFEDDDIDIDQNTFFSTIVLDSTLIKVEDEKPANGVADEVELETP